MRKVMQFAAIGLSAGLGLLGLTGAAVAQSNMVRVDGSSTVYPVTEAIAEEFLAQNPKIKVTVGISGTGGGFKKFCRGEIDVSNASRPILKNEMEDAKKNGVEYIELPIAFDALTVVINKENTWARTMTVEQLKKLWEPAAQGKITRWNQIDPSWPDEKIDLYGAGTDSGTFDYFTEAVVGKAKSSRGDYTASENDNDLVKGVEGNKYALGYFGMAYYEAHKDKLQGVSVAWDKNAKTKEPVAPSAKNVLDGSYAPLSRPIFIYVSKKAVEEKPEVRQFVDFYLKNVKEMATEVKYVPLPDVAYEAIRSRFDKLQSGTVFGGENEVGVKIEDIVKREAK